MLRGLIGKKLGMTQVFSREGKILPVTVLEVGPCVVTQIKTKEKDGYTAIQMGFGFKKPKNITKPVAGHLAKSGGGSFRLLKEFITDTPEEFELGQKLTIEMFKIGEKIDITGLIKGRGFQGVVKRHGFSGGPKTHGSKTGRIPGSIGTSAWPSRVYRGKKLPGQFGNEKKTVRNLEIVDIRPDENLILLKGAVPGAKNGFIELKKKKF